MTHRWLLGLAAAGLTACGSATSPSAPPATFTEIYAAIFPVHQKAQCSYCHTNPPNDIGNGHFSTGADQASAYAAIVNQPSTSSKCPGWVQVVPGHPEKSLFYLKLTASPPCAGRMSLGGDPLTDDQLEMVRSWIAAGAMND
jgi:hypothetical protein